MLQLPPPRGATGECNDSTCGVLIVFPQPERFFTSGEKDECSVSVARFLCERV